MGVFHDLLLIRGTRSDITKIDFSNYKVKVLNVLSDEFNEFVNNLEDSEFGEVPSREVTYLLHRIKKDSYNTEIFMFMPNSFNVEFSIFNYFECLKVLKIIKPNNMQVVGSIAINGNATEKLTLVGADFFDSDSQLLRDFENFEFADEELSAINSLIDLYSKRCQNISYINRISDSYISSFYQKNYTMQFILLCICLESIVSGTEQVTYRLKRNVSLICADNRVGAEILYKNIDNLYGIRSSIVHGGEFSIEYLRETLPYLRNLVSRMIIELLLLNYRSVEDLNKDLNFAGFDKIREIADEKRYPMLRMESIKIKGNIFEKLRPFRKKKNNS